MLTPRIETVVAEKQGKILLAKVDIDENTDLALDYHVSLPIHINRYNAMRRYTNLEKLIFRV